MATNFSKLKSDKTELFLLSSCFSKIDNTLFSLNNAETAVQPKSSARNIGVLFDSNLKLEAHINQICHSAHLPLRNIGAICKYLDQSTASSLVHAFVYRKLDLRDALLINLPDCLSDNYNKCRISGADV